MRFFGLSLNTYIKILSVLAYVSVIAWLYFLPPATIINALGIQNSYLLLFFMAFIGGISTFVTIPYVFVMAGLAIGGLNPILLGLVAATGELTGDSTSYWLGYYASGFLPKPAQAWFNRLSTWYVKYPRLMPIIFFFYGGFTPFSNDFVTIPMAMMRYGFWKVMIPLGLGNIVYNVGIAVLSLYAYGFVSTWL